jgi:signal transduction histidine kinase
MAQQPTIIDNHHPPLAAGRTEHGFFSGGAERGDQEGFWTQSPMRQLRMALLLAVVVVGLIFAMYEVLERSWLHSLDHSTLHLLHRLRGLFAALIAAAFVGWFVTRGVAPFQTEGFSAQQWFEGRRPSKEQGLILFARWFIVMRWVAMAGALLFLVLAVHVTEMLPQEVWRPVSLLLILLGILNLGYGMALRADWNVSRLLMVQAYADLVMLTLLLHLSGGVENPYPPLMLFHVIIAAIVLSRRQGFCVAVAGSILFALMAGGELIGWLHHYEQTAISQGGAEAAAQSSSEIGYILTRVGIHALILLFAAYFAGSLANKMRHNERQLEQLADRAFAQGYLLERSMDVTATGMCVCDPNLKPYWVNDRWRTWFGGMDLQPLLQKDGWSPLRASQSGSWAIELEVNGVGQGKETGAPANSRFYRITAAPFSGPREEGGHIACLAQDITEEKRAQEEMVRSKKLAAMGEVACKFAHEVNNPIGIIMGKLHLVLRRFEDDLPEKVVDELKKVSEEVDRISRISKNLLSHHRCAEPVRKDLDLAGLLRSVIGLIEERASASSVQIVDRLPRSLPQIAANADEMEQIFLNLALNSLDAMPAGGVLTFTGATREEENGTRLEVIIADTGTGMKPAVARRVFEPFFTTKPPGKGTGLGLSICLGLVNSHGGTIELESEEGNGTRVRVTFPAARHAATRRHEWV